MSKPVHEIKMGTVKVAIWERETEKFGTQTSYSVTKSYKDKDGNWQNPSVTLNNTTDIFCVIQALQKAMEWKYLKEDDEPKI